MSLNSDTLTPIAWVGVIFALIILVFAWLIYITRGRRETRVQFTGLGVSFTIDSSDKDPAPTLPKVEVGTADVE